MGKFEKLPKVGDRVAIVASEVVRHWNEHWATDVGVRLNDGDLIYVTKVTPGYLGGQAGLTISAKPGGRGPRWTIDRFAPAETASLTIEVGKFYKTRDGQKVGPMEFDGTSTWPFGGEIEGRGLNWFTRKGRWWTDSHDEPLDIIAEWIDEPAVALPASNDNTLSKFKLGDRVRIVKNTREEYLTKHIGNEFVVTSLEGSDGSKVAGETLPYWYPASEIELVTPTAPSTPAIVALIENGTAKPATRPKVHADQARAATEAERLALQFPGQQFGVFVLATSKIADVVNVPTAVLRAA